MELGNPGFDHESATGTEMGSGIAEAVGLLPLGSEIPDRVEDQVDERCIRADAGLGHVADGHGDVGCTFFATEFLEHRLGEVDPEDRDPGCGQRECQSPGTDGELDCGAGPCKLDEERHRRIDRLWRESTGDGLVVASRILGVEMLIGHRQMVDQDRTVGGSHGAHYGTCQRLEPWDIGPSSRAGTGRRGRPKVLAPNGNEIGMTMATARYDEIAQWYETEFLAYQRRGSDDRPFADTIGIDQALLELLGFGSGLCLEVGCGAAHYSLAGLINRITEAGFRIEQSAEGGAPTPITLSFRLSKLLS